MFGFSSSHADWKLDAVSILAVLGESNIRIHAHTITFSKFCLLPRLVPAPQAFLRESRPRRLPLNDQVKVYVNGAPHYPQTPKQDGLNYIPNILHQPDRLPAYSVTEANLGIHWGNKQPAPRNFSPLNLLATIGLLFTVGLLVWSVILRDGVAFVGVLAVSLASSALGYASSWRLKLPARSARSANRIPVDVILQTRYGAFVVVHCSWEIAQRLYLSPEECIYRMSNRIARAFGGVIGGLFITTAVIFFANCSWTMQAAIAVAYVSLNIAYWLVAAFPESNHWDLSCYEFQTSSPMMKESWTSAVSQAITLSKSTRWVQNHNIVPDHEVWKQWLKEAADNLGNVSWDPEEALSRILGEVQ